jgi:hypothetical protein
MSKDLHDFTVEHSYQSIAVFGFNRKRMPPLPR